MMPSPKVQLAIVIVGAIAATLQLWIKHRQAVELKEKEAAAQKALAEERAATAERAARHAREAAEREAEREQKERLYAELVAANKRTLDFLEAELKTRNEVGERRYELIERNTAATEKLVSALAAQGQELRVLVDRIGRLEGGAGCRAEMLSRTT